MSVKEFVKQENMFTVVCNAKGKAIKLEKAQKDIKLKDKKILGTDIYPTETGKMMYVWID